MAAVTGTRETFRFLAFGWDVDHARELIAARGDDPEPDSHAQVDALVRMMMRVRDGRVERITDRHGNQFMTGGVQVDLGRAEALPDEAARTAGIAVTVRNRPGEPDAHLLIDGWHRAWKAHTLGSSALPVYVLTEDEERACRLPESAPMPAEAHERRFRETLDKARHLLAAIAGSEGPMRTWGLTDDDQLRAEYDEHGTVSFELDADDRSERPFEVSVRGELRP